MDALLKNQIRKGLGLWISELLTVKFHERYLVKILLDFLLNFKSTLLLALYFVLEHDPLTTIKELFGSDFRVVSQIACIIDTRDEIFGEVCFLLPPSEAIPVKDLISLVCCLAKTAIEETLKFFLALFTFETMSKMTLAKIEGLILIAGEGLLVGVGSGGGCEQYREQEQSYHMLIIKLQNHALRERLVMIAQNSSSLINPSLSRSARSIISISSASSMFSPTSFETCLRFFTEMKPVFASSNRANTRRRLSFESLAAMRAVSSSKNLGKSMGPEKSEIA